MTLLIAVVLGSMAVIMTTAWTYQRREKNSGWTDVFWTYGTGATCALAALAPFGQNDAPTWRQYLVAALVAIWALRLGTYVAVRVAGGAEDVRYATLKREWGEAFQRRMLGLAMVQAPATALLSVSVLLAARRPDPSLRATDVIGAAILALAIAGEAVADRQMKRFKADPANHGKVCDTGLWGWSRHPNYLFEALGWIAYPVIALQPALPWTWAAWVAPVVMFLILRYGTGVPPLEAAQLRSKGDAYRRYQARVSPFLPRPPKDIRP
jgi:steroid 5-alpha reductase family enzyme